ncbi:DUF4286 family protein [Gramella sp. AN32]|uniref:DUF4286 family protein n=1 Tax=Christiangramia antarctica TaxID=2058158 RepID=A0ABW5X3Y0_9FLAO|nr:DUF4286 family protein [Gramella sp. AN32]MCM4156376.1 DUF4286 domain-containing protein [Gramella sp. AN32]
MIIYNVTINVQEGIHDEWLQWMKNEHIPEMLKTGKFIKALMTRVMEQETMGGITYSVQYTAENKEKLKSYYAENAPKLREKTKRFGDKILSFRTELEVITEL